MAVRPSDQKGQIMGPTIEVLPYQFGKTGAVERFAALIEDDCKGAGGNCRSEALGLLCEPPGRCGLSRFGKLANVDPYDSAGTARRFGALKVVSDELLLGSGLEPPDRRYA
jgi:hypothetical protein